MLLEGLADALLEQELKQIRLQRAEFVAVVPPGPSDVGQLEALEVRPPSMSGPAGEP
jgi:hypothetical protein